MTDSNKAQRVPKGLARYARQFVLPQIGEAGQLSLRHAQVTLVGCGALGSHLASTLVRAGVGFVRIIDRDFVELDNLQRQVLFDEADVRENLPKAEAAARKLHRVNSGVEVEARVCDLHAGNAAELCEDADLLLDGTDNLTTRYLINDLAVREGVPWVYGGCIGTEGLVLPVWPGRTPCLRCVFPDPPTVGELPTCETAGILGATAAIVANLQSVAAIQLLVGGAEAVAAGRLTTVDVWNHRVRSIDVSPEHSDACPCCGRHEFEFLDREPGVETTTLCGQNAIQVMPTQTEELNLRRLAGRLPAHMRPQVNEFMLKFKTDDHVIAVFPDGRALVQGTSDPAVARNVYARYIGT